MRWLARVVLHKIQKLLVVGMLVSFGFGISGIWHGCRNSTPTIMSLTQNAPGDLPKNVTLKNVALGVTEAVTNNDFREKAVYIPVRARGSAPTDKIHLLLKTSNQELVGLTKKSDAKSENVEGLRNAITVLAKVAAQTEITGMMETDFNVPNRLKSALRKALPALHPDFQIINEGETPSVLRGILLLALAGGLFVLVGISSIANVEKPQPPPLNPPAPPPLQPQA